MTDTVSTAGVKPIPVLPDHRFGIWISASTIDHAIKGVTELAKTTQQRVKYINIFTDFADHEDEEILVINGWIKPFMHNMMEILKNTDDSARPRLDLWQEMYSAMYDRYHEESFVQKGAFRLAKLFPASIKCVVIVSTKRMDQIILKPEYLSRFRLRFSEVVYHDDEP